MYICIHIFHCFSLHLKVEGLRLVDKEDNSLFADVGEWMHNAGQVQQNAVNLLRAATNGRQIYITLNKILLKIISY